jgi:hypothetical protein
MAINDFEDMVLSDPPPKQPELQINSHQEAEIVRLRDTIGSLRREISMYAIALDGHVLTVVP